MRTLAKIMQWKSLTEELSAMFGTEPNKLPVLVQTVLEIASEGQALGMKQAKKEPPPVRKRHRHTTTQPKAGPNLATRIISVMKPGEELTGKDILTRLQKANQMPPSKKPLAYIGAMLSQYRETLFMKGSKPGTWSIRKDPVQPTKESVKSLPAVKEAEQRETQRQVYDALIAAPKAFETMFHAGKLSKKLNIPGDSLRSVLEALNKAEIVAKLGGTRWRLRDRAALKLMGGQKAAFANGAAEPTPVMQA